MAYRRERNIRDMYEERFLPDRSAPYPRGAGTAPMERRPAAFGRPEEEYSRGFEYDSPRFYPNGGPRSYHGEDQRGYHGDSLHFPTDRRSGPPSRRPEEPYPFPSRGPPREDPHTARPMEFSSSRVAPPPPGARPQGIYPTPRALSAVVPEGGDDTLMQAILSLDRGPAEDREAYRRKAPFPPLRERSPLRRTEVPPSPHSRSGSSVSSRGYSPDRSKGLAYPPQQKSGEYPEVPCGAPVAGGEQLWGGGLFTKMAPGPVPLDKDRPPGQSHEGSPQSTASAKEEAHILEAEREEGPPPIPDPLKTLEDFQERRAQAITAKAQEIEKVYRQDCETFGMVVKMLVAKDPGLEKQLQIPLRENLGEIRDRCLDDLKHYISMLDEVVRQPEPST